MKTVRIVVTGRVTGVGFRFSAVSQADDLRGWVRNRDSRTVEALVQGDTAAVDAMVGWFRQGTSGAKIRTCNVETVENAEKQKSFHVAH